MRKALGLGTRGAPSRWKDVKDHVEKIRAACAAHLPVAIADVLHDSDRWAPPKKTDTLPSDVEVSAALSRMRPWTKHTTADLWSTMFNGSLSKV